MRRIKTDDTGVLKGIETEKSKGAFEYRSENIPIWCPGCGYFGVSHALNYTLTALSIKPENFVMVSGIGCSGRFPGFMKCYGFHTLHGRPLPVAQGVKMARPDLTVVVMTGDGDGLGIGGGHLPHAVRRNVDITCILLDNTIYGLTKGQASPTTPTGIVTATTPYGNPDEPVLPELLILSYRPGFLASVSSAEPDHLAQIFEEAISHRGFSFVRVFSPCVTFDERMTYDFLREKLKPLPEEHDPTDFEQALRIAASGEPRTGIFYRVRKKTFDERDEDTRNKAKKSGPSDFERLFKCRR
ncbi:MAG: thiamine pyrophosphate-dependent enzyme [Candidatus Glassbacteria bacterium]